MQLELKPYDLKLKHTFTISRVSIDVQPTLIVALTVCGVTGYGAATANPYYNITVEKMHKTLLELKEKIELSTATHPEEFWSEMLPHLKGDLFSLCALDMAFTDLCSRQQGQKLYEYWNYDITNNPLTNYTIGIASIEKMVQKMQELPWPIYKIKLGTKEDIAIITELRKYSNAIFRVDANCGWDVQETIDNSYILKDLGVEFIEQPLKADNWTGHKEVFNHAALPIIADESCIIETDITKCHGYFHGVNIKLMKCGGLTPAKRMLENAKHLGLKTMVGCMTESNVGISAIAHLLPLLDYVDMDGALLLKEDIADGITLDYGKVHYSSTIGTGVALL